MVQLWKVTLHIAAIQITNPLFLIHFLSTRADRFLVFFGMLGRSF
jgi:hypothetical protein